MFLNQTTHVVAEYFTENLIDHRGFHLGRTLFAKFRLKGHWPSGPPPVWRRVFHFFASDHDTIHIYSNPALRSYNVTPWIEKTLCRRMAEKTWLIFLPKSAIFQGGF